MTVRILTGDCRDILATLPDESVHCCITSPPYWGLRDYGTAQWEGGDAACKHGAPYEAGQSNNKGNGNGTHPGRFVDCACGARRIDSQLGLEPDYRDYLKTMVAVFREVKRVLRKDGTCFVNMGDSYFGTGKGPTPPTGIHGANSIPYPVKGVYSDVVLKPKDLCGIPWRLAFALQEDGWWLRSDIIWSKPNPMPESVTDRPTKAHEYLFLLSKSERYYYDAEAIREDGTRYEWNTQKFKGGDLTRHHGSTNGKEVGDPNAGRNRRTVWEIATAPFSEAHFATFPPALVEPCIKAGTSEKGCCAKCGAPWVREVSCTPMVIDRSLRTHEKGQTRPSGTMLQPPKSKTLGWSPSCLCYSVGSVEVKPGAEVVPSPLMPPTTPCTVLDPFGGAGTVGLVADRLGRNAILIELNPDYAAMAEKRLRGDAGLFAEVSSGTGWDQMWSAPFHAPELL